MTLIPAYGRDYASPSAVKADWKAGKDFIVNDCSSPWDGRYCNRHDLAQTDRDHVMIRYHARRKIMRIEL